MFGVFLAHLSIWTKLSGKCFQCLVVSMPGRINVVLKAKRSPTGVLTGIPNKVAYKCDTELCI